MRGLRRCRGPCGRGGARWLRRGWGGRIDEAFVDGDVGVGGVEREVRRTVADGVGVGGVGGVVDVCVVEFVFDSTVVCLGLDGDAGLVAGGYG